MMYNVTVGFQYQVTANDNISAADIARGFLVDDLESCADEYSFKSFVERSITTVHPGLDYAEIVEQIWQN